MEQFYQALVSRAKNEALPEGFLRQRQILEEKSAEKLVGTHRRTEILATCSWRNMAGRPPAFFT